MSHRSGETVVELDGEVYLPIWMFKEEFSMCNEREVRRYVKNGMPYRIINGVRMYPRGACHRWFAGEEKGEPASDQAAEDAMAAGVTIC